MNKILFKPRCTCKVPMASIFLKRPQGKMLTQTEDKSGTIFFEKVIPIVNESWNKSMEETQCHWGRTHSYLLNLNNDNYYILISTIIMTRPSNQTQITPRTILTGDVISIHGQSSIFSVLIESD